MTATQVYGVNRGDRFEAEDGEIVTVVEFITPTSPNKEWVVMLDSEEELLVKDLIKDFRKVDV